MSPFKRIITVLSITVAGLAFIATVSRVSAQSDPYSTLKLTLQTQGGWTAYSQITSSLPLAQLQSAFSKIDVQNGTYILGDYILSGRSDKVKLAIGADGWAIASMPRSMGVEYLYDSYSDYTTAEAEKAVNQIGAMVGVTAPLLGYYDFSAPQATGAVMHWLYETGNQDISSTITPTIWNTYLDRGYCFFTAASNSTFWLNGQVIDSQGAIYQIVYRWGKLGSDQLRVGQGDVLRINSFTLFGTGLIGGISTIYSGTTPIVTFGGSRRDFVLAYPAMLGAPIVVKQIYLPAVKR